MLKAKQPTISDVARRANVSIKTVSRVFNQSPNVSDSKKQSVLSAAKELGYRPNHAARRLAGSKSFVIAHFHDNSNADYVSKIYDGLHMACTDIGYYVVAEKLDVQSDSYVDACEKYLNNHDVDGIILTPPVCDDVSLLNFLDEAGLIYARISPYQRAEDGTSVYIDDRAAAAQMTEYLIRLGHERIAFIAGPANHGASMARLHGFEQVMRNAFPNSDAPLILQGDFSTKSGFVSFEEIRKTNQKVTAIFAANDEMAVGSLMAAYRDNIRVPEDLSIVGFDNSRLSEIIWPPLTTVKQPIQEMAERVATLLLGSIRSGKSVQIQEKFDIEVTKRMTSSPINAPIAK
jgi:LacI family transcriptional regulator